MKRLIRWTIIFGVIGTLIWLTSWPVATYLQERSRITYREAPVTRGKIVAVVNATGTIKPVRQVSVGSFVGGPIVKIYVDYNAAVTKDQILAKIDPQLYDAAVLRDSASLALSKASVLKAEAQLKQAERNLTRAEALRAENTSFISAQEMDQFKYTYLSMKADLAVAVTQVELAEANLKQSKTNLAYTVIRAPEAGVVIDRKIDTGQTVQAQFQTPELFIVAPDLKAEMYVHANVDEADIGMIRKAQAEGQPVRFTVDAYPDDLFEGKIYQVRQSSTTTQNVVTYPVVISARNPDMKLMPGMTASLSFQLREVQNVLRIPNAALRFYPQREQVRPEDREILEIKGIAREESENVATTPSAEEKAELRRQRSRRHVWIHDGDFLRAVPVVTGVTSNQHTEVVSGALSEGDKLVTGIQPKQ
jgi:HlyD family secretion protein